MGGVEWIDLAHDKHMWRTLVKTVMNLRLPSSAKNVLCS